MGTIEYLILAVGLSMDAFAVSVCKGLAMGKPTWRQAAVPGLWFGGFQAREPSAASGPSRASRSILTPRTASRPKAIQWSMAVM